MGSKMTTDLIEIAKNPQKEVFTFRLNDKYYAVVTGEDKLYVSPESFDSPLKASNHARSIKRQHKIDVKIKKEQKPSVLNTAGRIPRKKHLYTEAEMASETKLKFREVWVILGPRGDYAANVLNEQTVVSYVSNKDEAQTYRTYEDAIITLNVLDRVIRKGHQLRRFFERTDLS